MYASLLISLLAAFVAMLGKQWLNRYLRNSGGSVIERCGDRQRKCDGLEKWPLHFFVESLPVMLQVSLLLLACGLCRRMWSINASVACTLVILTGLGVIFYIAIVIAGMSSYACPFQTPASIALRGPWKKVRCGIVSSIVHSKQVFSRTRRMWNRCVRPLLHRQSLPIIPLENIPVQQSELLLTLNHIPQSEPWLEPKDLSSICRTNTNDLRCVSWILRNITDPEVLDAAIRLAGEVRWFDDGTNVDLPYSLIVSTFKACFDSTRTLYPGSRDRAYYSGRAMVWIQTLAMCKFDEPARTAPLLITEYTDPTHDPGLKHLLWINMAPTIESRFIRLLGIYGQYTPSHSQWISNVLLHLSWANRTTLNFEFILGCIPSTHETTIPANATLNRLLVWCTFLGSPVEEEALKVQDKSYGTSRCLLQVAYSAHMERILYQLSKAIVSAINGTNAQRRFIPHVLGDLIKLETRPVCLTEIAYAWCSVICENRQSLRGWKNLLPVCLEIGFRHLDVQSPYIKAKFTHTVHHRELIDIIFKSRGGEAIADLLHALTMSDDSPGWAHTLLGICTGHLVGLHNLVPFSSRLRRRVIRFVELIGYRGFEGIGVDSLVELLNHLHVTVEDMDRGVNWAILLLDTIQSSERTRHLSHWYWELLVEFVVSNSLWLRLYPTHGLRIITSLTKAEEWSKLECWTGIVWILSPWDTIAMAERDLGHSMVLLFRQRPQAVQKLEQWMERWCQKSPLNRVPDSFRRICKQAHEAAQQDTP